MVKFYSQILFTFQRPIESPEFSAAGDLQVLAMPGKCKHGSRCRFAHTMDSWGLAGYLLVNVYIAMENRHFNSR